MFEAKKEHPHNEVIYCSICKTEILQNKIAYLKCRTCNFKLKIDDTFEQAVSYIDYIVECHEKKCQNKLFIRRAFHKFIGTQCTRCTFFDVIGEEY